MQIENYLKNYQPTIYKTFINSLQKDKVSHAYLLVGNPGTPLKDVAFYLAKSILCDDPSPLACNNCITCLRIDSDNYPDFIFYDGSKSSIKKENIKSISSQFEKTSLETKGIMVYILHLVENMTDEAINSILKFLEEPKKNVFAFLTTNNENSILPTIVSRCQTLHLKLIERASVISSAIDLGVNKEDAELLSYFYNDGELILDFVRNGEESKFYFDSKKALFDLLECLAKSDHKQAVYYTQNKIAKLVNKKESFRFFLDMLAQIFEDLLNIQNNKQCVLTSYDTILHDLSKKLCHVDQSLLEILKQRNLANININIPLQLDHLIFTLTKE